MFIIQVQEALNNVANISSETNIANSDQKSNENKKDTDQTNNQSPALKGVSQSLIEKVCETVHITVFDLVQATVTLLLVFVMVGG